ncbi:amidohydrolase [Aspergillus carlsbadensis]|nr:amidohydrolase [Aspergillus carlsbadensis]
MPGKFEYRRRRVLRRWRVPTCAGICAAIALLVYLPSDLALQTSSSVQESFSEGLQQCQAEGQGRRRGLAPSRNRENPRWNPVTGQSRPVVIQNASLFDGETFLPDFVDIILDAGVIRSVVPAGSDEAFPHDAYVIHVHGKHVTPGLVDMHSHHLESPFPALSGTTDINERPLLGPVTPFVRALDGFTPTDPAIKHIASGGVTTSLNLPGSTNIVGGQAYPVKNFPFSGQDGEPVIQELLLEYGIPESQRQRYLKMACGENPRRFYGYTRLGLAWLLREKLAEAQELQKQQAEWCSTASEIQERSRLTQGRHISSFLRSQGPRPESFELETLVALIRGDINLNVHCYTPEDLETMLSVLHEFGIHPQAFHHALEAWQVPEWLKKEERNITIATFADNALYKAEAYGANLRGPKILHDHGVKVALKSDHTGESQYAKYLLDQASISHSFGLPAVEALRAVTSIPADSIYQGHRIGYVRPGYDADVVIWNDHPLQVGATPVQVFIDGRPLLPGLDNAVGQAATGSSNESGLSAAPAVRPFLEPEERNQICSGLRESQGPVLFTGIQKALIDLQSVETDDNSQESTEPLVYLITRNGESCIGPKSTCLADYHSSSNITEISLKNGYITPGLIAFGNNLGIQDIPSEPSSGDGSAGTSGDALNEAKTVHFAKYSAHLHGKAFDRARIGGVTKAISPPHGSGVVQGVSVGISTAPDATILDGGIWKDEVALHLVVGQGAKDGDTPTVGSGIEVVRRILEHGSKEGADSGGVYARAANGSLPVVVQALHQDDIAHLVLVKRDFPTVNLVLYGGHGAALVAKPLAEAKIPVILSGNRGAPDTWEKKDTLPGPPLSDIPAKVLLDAGVQLGLAVRGDSKLHGLAREARWAGKHAGLDDKEAIALVSSNLERILGLQHVEERNSRSRGGFVVWEGNPLRGEGSVVASVSESGVVVDCWPDDGLS